MEIEYSFGKFLGEETFLREQILFEVGFWFYKAIQKLILEKTAAECSK